MLVLFLIKNLVVIRNNVFFNYLGHSIHDHILFFWLNGLIKNVKQYKIAYIVIPIILF